MKFMGSKVELLRGPLGRLLLREASASRRFVDLFSGSGSVARFVAERVDIPVLSSDLQRFAAMLSGAVIERAEPYVNPEVIAEWCKNVGEQLNREPQYRAWSSTYNEVTAEKVLHARRVAASRAAPNDVFTRQYAGHYFSPVQALELDRLHQALPADGIDRTVALASLIQAASRCAASPGHTAQPFQPTSSLLPHIRTAWSRSMKAETQRSLEAIARRHALAVGTARQMSAEVAVETIREGDTVFCDPPYSDVQYSRFYHVLEGIAEGGWPAVSGSGRAPELSLRARSDFSLRSQSASAMETLLGSLYERKCRSVVITFPNTEASNGLSARKISALGRAGGWKVTKHLIDSTHSTLGGLNDGGTRGSRRDLREAVLVMSRA